jgi:hypothetical protein
MIPVDRATIFGKLQVAPSNPQLLVTAPALRIYPQPPPHLLIAGLLPRTGVTLSPHLSLCAPPLPALTLSRLDIAPAHKDGLEAPDRLKGHTGTGRCNHGARRKSPRYCQFPRFERIAPDYAIAIAITRARAHTRTGHLTSSSRTAPLPRQPAAQWYASMSSSDMAFASLPLPYLGTIAHDRTRWRCMPRNRGRGYGWPHFSDPFTSHLCTSALRFCLTLTRRAQPCIRMHPTPLALVHHPRCRSWSPGSMACTHSPLRNSLTGPRAL